MGEEGTTGRFVGWARVGKDSTMGGMFRRGVIGDRVITEVRRIRLVDDRCCYHSVKGAFVLHTVAFPNLVSPMCTAYSHTELAGYFWNSSRTALLCSVEVIMCWSGLFIVL